MPWIDREKAARKCHRIEEKYFPGHLWPGDVYRKELEALNRESLRVGHLGCGHDRRKIRKVLDRAWIVGFDLDRKSLERLKGKDRLMADLGQAPVADESFDLLVCEMVFEHFENPEAVIREACRILKPGGRFLFLTINKNSIPGRITAWTPFFLHRWINRVRPVEVDEEDVFPTWYRLNSYKKIQRVFNANGFVEEKFLFLDATFPYLEFCPFLYRLGSWFNLLLLRYEWLRGFRLALLGVYQKTK